MEKTIHIVSVSGGKDSAVTLAIAIARVGKETVRAIYCDTGYRCDIFGKLVWPQFKLSECIAATVKEKPIEKQGNELGSSR